MRKAFEADPEQAKAWHYTVSPDGKWIGIAGSRIRIGKGRGNYLSRKKLP
jgi:hypothetical protein